MRCSCGGLTACAESWSGLISFCGALQGVPTEGASEYAQQMREAREAGTLDVGHFIKQVRPACFSCTACRPRDLGTSARRL